MEQYLPGSILKPFIKTFLIIESEHGMENSLLPDTSITMAFRFKGKVTLEAEGIEDKLPVSVISGLRKTPRLVSYAKNTSTLIVMFNEAGAAAFFKEPLHALFGISVSLDHLIPRCKLNEIEEQLAEAKNNPQRIAIVERFLLSELKEPRSDLLVLKAIQKIKSSKGTASIRNLIAGLPVSRDPFEKRFRRITGTSPKQFSAIVRLRNLIDHYSQAAGQPGRLKSLTEAAHAAGYFDQAHFIKDFKSFTGQTPRHFFKSPAYW